MSRSVQTEKGKRSLDLSPLAIGAAWFTTSAIFSTWANTSFLQRFQSPVLHSLVRFVGAAFLSAAALGGRRAWRLVTKDFAAFLTSGFFLFVANWLNSVALAWSGVTLTYTVKALIPVFTVALLSWRERRRYSTKVYLSLVPTVVGVAVASWSDSSFSVVGIVAALGSAVAQTYLNVRIKAVRKIHAEVSGFESFFILASTAALVALPVSLVAAISNGWVKVSSVESGFDGAALSGQGLLEAAALSLAAALAYQFEYALNFEFVAKVEEVTFSVADVCRRLAIIVAGAILFSKPLTLVNVAGVALALGGVLAYSMVVSGGGGSGGGGGGGGGGGKRRA